MVKKQTNMGLGISEDMMTNWNLLELLSSVRWFYGENHRQGLDNFLGP